MEKLGQLDKIIASIPVFILIFIIMGIFVALAFGLRGFKTSPVAVGISEELLLKEISLALNGEEKKMLVFDAIVLFQQKKIGYDKLNEILSSFLNKENECLGLAIGERTDPAGLTGGEALDDFFFKLKNNKIDSYHLGARVPAFEPYRDVGILRQISFVPIGEEPEKRIFVEYYYGGCVS